MGGEHQRLAGVVGELIKRNVIGADFHVSDFAQLRIIQRDLCQRLQHFGQPATIHHQQEILESAIRAAP
ncbi:hypothetical protein D3C75_1313400 [compost metagenome]